MDVVVVVVLVVVVKYLPPSTRHTRFDKARKCHPRKQDIHDFPRNKTENTNKQGTTTTTMPKIPERGD